MKPHIISIFATFVSDCHCYVSQRDDYRTNRLLKTNKRALTRWKCIAGLHGILSRTQYITGDSSLAARLNYAA